MVRIDPEEGPQPGPFRPDALAAALNAHAVDYVVVGGIAAIRHGSRRSTRDLDVVPAPTRENSVRLAGALAELGAQLRGVDAHTLDIDPTDPEVLAGGADFGLATEHGFLDLLGDTAAIDYAGLRARARPARLGAERILVADVDDLIAMKLRAGRPIDLQDIAAITAHARAQRPPPRGGSAPAA